MRIKAFTKMARFPETDSRVFVLTANERGITNISAPEACTILDGGNAEITCCSCSEMMANLWENPHIALLIWNTTGNNVYQAEGSVREIRDGRAFAAHSSKVNASAANHDEIRVIVALNEVREIPFLPGTIRGSSASQAAPLHP